MEFGVGLLGYQGCWDDAAFAEEHGFSTAGFVDSPLIAGDPWVCLGLAAQATSTIRIGTFLTVPGMRTAAATASAIATVARVAPGRTFLGVGTGHTSRDTLGLGPIPARQMRDFALDCRELLDGAEITHQERPIRFRHGSHLSLGPVAGVARVPIYVGADGPKAIAAAGAAGDGLVVTLKASHAMGNAPEVFAGLLADVRAAAATAGRSFDHAYTMWSTAMCILEEGESAASPRVLERVGAAAMMAYHSYACHPEIADYLPPAIADRIDIYEREVLSRLGVPRDRVYQEVNAGHLAYLIDGEAAVLTDEVVRMTTLTGTAQDIAGQVRRLEAAGLRNVTVWASPARLREAIVAVAEEIMPLVADTTPAA